MPPPSSGSRSHGAQGSRKRTAAERENVTSEADTAVEDDAPPPPPKKIRSGLPLRRPDGNVPQKPQAKTAGARLSSTTPVTKSTRPLASSAPRSSTSAPTLGMKSLTDTVADLKSGLASLKVTVRGIEDGSLQNLEEQVDELEDSVTRMSKAVKVLQAEYKEIRGTLQAQDDDLTLLDKRFTTLEAKVLDIEGAGNEAGAAGRKKKRGKKNVEQDEEDQEEEPGEGKRKERNNALNNFVRIALYGLMGVEERGGKLPDPQMRGFWAGDHSSKDPERNQLLRPNFNITFAQQKTWHKEVARQVKAKGLGFSRILKESEVDALGEEEIVERLGSAFKGARSRYKKQQKEPDEKEEDETLKRRIARKNRKAKMRAKVRHLVRELDTSKLDWLFEVEYQSTDESHWEEVVSEASGGGHKATRVKAALPWTTRPPTYRAEKVTEWLDAIDVHRLAAQKKQDATRKKGAKFYGWTRGDPVIKPLPVVMKNVKRVRREFLDFEWIQEQDEEELKLYIYDPEEDDNAQSEDGNIDPLLRGRPEISEDPGGTARGPDELEGATREESTEANGSHHEEIEGQANEGEAAGEEFQSELLNLSDDGEDLYV